MILDRAFFSHSEFVHFVVTVDHIYVHVFGDLKWEVRVGPPHYCVEFLSRCPPWMNVLHAERAATKCTYLILIVVALGRPTWATRNPHVFEKRESALVIEYSYTFLYV